MYSKLIFYPNNTRLFTAKNNKDCDVRIILIKESQNRLIIFNTIKLLP